MIEKLGHYSLQNIPTVYDEEALTALELAGRTAAKMNETIGVVNETVAKLPQDITDEVQRQIDSGIFDDQIDKYGGELKQQVADCEAAVTEQVANATEELTQRMTEAENDLGARLDNLLGSVTEGTTTMDAEVIDGRTDVDGTTFASIGEAIRAQARRDQPLVYAYQGKFNWEQNKKIVSVIGTTGQLGGQVNFTARIGHKTYMFNVTDMPAELALTNGMTYYVVNYVNKTFASFAYNQYTYTAGDIILFACYDYKIWPMGLSVQCLYVDGNPMYQNYEQPQRYALTTQYPVIVDKDANTITMQAGYFIAHFSKYTTGHSYRINGSLSAPLTLTVEPKHETLEFVCYNSTNKTLRVVDRNYNIADDEYTLFAFMKGMDFIPLDLNPACVAYANEASGEPVSVDTYRSVSDIISQVVSTDRKLKIVLGGDSITHGAGGTGYNQNGEHIITVGDRSWHMNPNGYCWANLFRAYMEENYNVDVVNNGCTGTNSKFWNENKLELIPEDTDILILSIGTNDRLTNFATDKAGTLRNYYNNLCGIVDYCHARGIAVILCSPIPATAEQEQSASYFCKCMHLNGVVQKVAARYHMGYVNMYNAIHYAMRDNGTELDNYLADGLHPNDNGYNLMFYEILRAMELAPDYVAVD